VTKIGVTPNQPAPVSINRSASEITFTTIEFPGALLSFVGAINDRGQITGNYEDVSGVAHGFVAELKSLRQAAIPILGSKIANS
jgi:hypothetical protein